MSLVEHDLCIYTQKMNYNTYIKHRLDFGNFKEVTVFTAF